MAMGKQGSSSAVTFSQEIVIADPSSGSEKQCSPYYWTQTNRPKWLQWSKSVLVFVCGKEKDNYLTGVATTLAQEDLICKTWKSENSMVMSRLKNSMTNKIEENFMLYATAQEIWVVTKDTYSDKDNTSELFEVKGILNDLKQGKLMVTQYFNALKDGNT